MTRFRAVVLDMDGTLVYSSEAHIAAWLRAAETMGFKISKQIVESVLGRSSLDMARVFLPSGEKDKASELAELKDKVFLEQCLTLVKPIEGVGMALNELRRMGFKVAVASSNPRRVVTEVLRMNGLLTYVDAVIGDEDVERGKPYPDMVIGALRRLRVKPCEALYVGDTVYDVEAGRLAGVFTVAVLTGAGSMESLSRLKPDAVLESLAVLPEMLRKGI